MIYLVLMIFIQISCCANTGSSLFYKRSSRRDCWSNYDIASLRARQLFEQLIPPPVAPDKMNDRYVRDILGYFKRALKTAGKNSDVNTAIPPEDLLADTIGSHMRSEILPASRFAYYAGYISYRRARDLHDFYNNLKIMLNTQGLGWKLPARVKKWGNLTMEKIRIGLGMYANPCALLIFKRDTRSCIYLPTPKLDDSVKPSAIALPFKSGGLVSLESPKSENILLKYYTTGSRCILSNSPAKCRHSDFVGFNNDLWRWMKRDIAPHLVDEKLYSAFGGVLRIAAAVQSYGKGLSRRNIYSNRECKTPKWRPWKTVSEDSVQIDESTSYLYMFVVLSVATVICLLQVIYSNVFNEDGICRCKHNHHNVDVEYANVDLNIPAMLPRPNEPDLMKPEPRGQSTHTMRTQKVYDMHEDRDLDIAIEESDSDSESSMESEIIRELERQDPVIRSNKRNIQSLSPPRIETSISEIRLGKKRPITSRRSSYSTNSLITDSAQTFLRDETSSTESSSSGQSFSTSSKISKRRVRNTRDLAWARRVVSKQRLFKSTSGTEYKSLNTIHF